MIEKITAKSLEQQSELVFKMVGEREIKLSFLPPTKKLYKMAPLYFIISGGGWEIESKEDMIGFSKISVDALRERGFAIVSPDYRTVSEEGISMIDVITDCFDALRYVCYYADVLGIDKYNVITSGHSAGGHLALMLAYSNGDAFKCETSPKTDYKITATAPLSPITVMYDNGEYPKTHNLGTLDNRYSGCNNIETRKLTSPITYVSENCPPTLLCAGNKDDLVLCNSCEILFDQLKNKGVKCEIIISHNGGHCFEPMLVDKNSYPDNIGMQERLIDFILKYCKV